jgi:heme/copper-type cytochrome/quinol oxidase subunit 1
MTIRPHLLFLALALAEFALALFAGEATHAIEVDDTYLVIGVQHVRVGLGVLAMLLAATYWLMQRAGRPLPQRLGLLHFVMMVLGVVLPAVALGWAEREDTAVPVALVVMGIVMIMAGTLLMFAGLVLSSYKDRSGPIRKRATHDDQ